MSNRKQTGVVFNIQKFSLNDGPGIRTVVFLKGCPLRCRWCANPESQSNKVQMVWDAKKCVGCRNCVRACSKRAISFENDSIVFDTSVCDGCLACEKACIHHAIGHEGDTKSVQDVLDQVLQDQPFYEESGGGMTLSGGELLMQPEFAKQLLMAAKEEGLHTACETTGQASSMVFKKVMKYVDYVLFDVKHYQADTHKEYTGVDNTLILENLAYLVQAKKEVLVRIPVIPGFNDSLEDAKGLSNVLHSIGIEQCQILPFHQFGENKYDLLQKEYAYKGVDAYHSEDLMEYQQVFLDHQIRAFF